MKTLPLSEVKMRLSEIVEKVSSTDEEVTVTKNGRPAAVIVSLREFESWKETAEILSDREMMDDIRRGLRSLEEEGGKLYSLKELLG